MSILLPTGSDDSVERNVPVEGVEVDSKADSATEVARGVTEVRSEVQEVAEKESYISSSEKWRWFLHLKESFVGKMGTRLQLLCWQKLCAMYKEGPFDERDFKVQSRFRSAFDRFTKLQDDRKFPFVDGIHGGREQHENQEQTPDRKQHFRIRI